MEVIFLRYLVFVKGWVAAAAGHKGLCPPQAGTSPSQIGKLSFTPDSPPKGRNSPYAIAPRLKHKEFSPVLNDTKVKK